MEWFKNKWHQLQSRPDLSWRRFKLGVLLFAAAVMLLYAGAHYWIWLQAIGLVCLASGLGYAIAGYVGILAFRLGRFQRRPPNHRDFS